MRFLRFILSTTLLLASFAAAQTDLQILRATYGDGNTVRDVTSTVAAKVQNATLRVQAAPDMLGGDPIPGALKTLWIQYNYRGQAGEISAQDGAWIILPTTGRQNLPNIFQRNRGNNSQQQLTIISAQYGADPKWVDVKSMLESRIQNNALSVQAVSNNFGGDPIMGKAKTLRVTYSWQGQTYDVAIPENGTLNLPDSQMMGGVPNRPTNNRRGVQQQQSLLILTALYGAPAQPNSSDQAARRDRFNDVKSRLDSMIQNNALRVVVNNASLGADPAPANKKLLRVSYQWQGQTFQTSVDENGTLVIPDAAAVASQPATSTYPAASTTPAATTSNSSGGFFGGFSNVSGLRIVSATYGSGNRTMDVTNFLTSRIQNNTLSLSVNNETMGTDPAVGADKVLQVTYELNGNRQQVSVNEGKTLRIQ